MAYSPVRSTVSATAPCASTRFRVSASGSPAATPSQSSASPPSTRPTTCSGRSGRAASWTRTISASSGTSATPARTDWALVGPPATAARTFPAPSSSASRIAGSSHSSGTTTTIASTHSENSRRSRLSARRTRSPRRANAFGRSPASRSPRPAATRTAHVLTPGAARPPPAGRRRAPPRAPPRRGRPTCSPRERNEPPVTLDEELRAERVLPSRELLQDRVLDHVGVIAREGDEDAFERNGVDRGASQGVDDLPSKPGHEHAARVVSVAGRPSAQLLSPGGLAEKLLLFVRFLLEVRDRDSVDLLDGAPPALQIVLRDDGERIGRLNTVDHREIVERFDGRIVGRRVDYGLAFENR